MFNTSTMQFKISNVTKENQYKGSYARIFKILNEDRIFTEAYETDESPGLIENDYYLEIKHDPDPTQLERIIKLKNVTLFKE